MDSNGLFFLQNATLWQIFRLFGNLAQVARRDILYFRAWEMFVCIANGFWGRMSVYPEEGVTHEDMQCSLWKFCNSYYFMLRKCLELCNAAHGNLEKVPYYTVQILM